MKKTIGVVTALPGEARALAGSRFCRKAQGLPFCRTVLKDEIDLVVVQSGMGMENAFSAANWLTEKGVAALGIFGVSGGLDPDLRVGDLVFADAVLVQQDEETSLVWKKAGVNSELNPGCSGAEGFKGRWGAVLTVQQPILNVAGKRALFDRTGAMAVDMETAAVASVAKQSGLPFFAIRTICDAADVSISEALYQCVDQKGRPRFAYLFRQIFQKPFLISHLLRMKKDFTAALAVAPHVRHFLSEMHNPPAP